MVAKVVGFLVVNKMIELLSPRQLGYDVHGAVEAAVQTAKMFLHNWLMSKECWILEMCSTLLAYKGRMFEAVRDLAHLMYPLLCSA